MRTILCPLIIFLLFLPWRLNSHLTLSTTILNNHEDITDHHMLTGTTDDPSGHRQFTVASGMENVVSLSSSNEKQHLTSKSHSEQQGIRVKTSSGEGETLNKTTKRNVDDSQNNLSTPAEPGRQKVGKEVTTPQKELLKPTESSPRPQAISTVHIQNTTEFDQEVPKNQRADNLPQEKTTRLPSSSTEKEMQEVTQEIASTSDSPDLYDPQINGTDGKTTHTNDLHTVQLTMDATVQPSSITQVHTSAVITATDFNKIITGLSTEGVKATRGPEITKERKAGDIQGPELKTRSTVQPTVKTSTTTPPYTTKKTTIKLVPKPPTKASSNNKHQKNPGAAVAAVIGTTFFLMFIAILVILIRKNKIQKRQLENPEWAGPSPFLDGEIQPNLPEMDVSDRYLPQRLSKHLTLRRNTNEDICMGDILQGSTFARQSLNELQEPNGKPVGQSPTKIEENENQPGSSFMVSPNTKPPAEENPAVTVDIQESIEQTDDISPSPSSGTDSVIKPFPTLVSIDLDSLSEEPAPLQTTDVGIVPPDPPLP
ncbi:protein EVI2B-like [Myxocyprinus asiaticus]|uniref:protein EVI2B-like n=1 Tax=Myxocyprinus asiaticus TaxID=70543 RepID=UPI00222147B1|nr:protein EVI2B-like [Myxocyprinus asiaticus]